MKREVEAAKQDGADELHKVKLELAKEKIERENAESVCRDYLKLVYDNKSPDKDAGAYYQELLRREKIKRDQDQLHEDRFAVKVGEANNALTELVMLAREERRQQERVAERYYHELKIDMLTLEKIFGEKLHVFELGMRDIVLRINEKFSQVQKDILHQEMWFKDALNDVEMNQVLMESGIDKKLLGMQSTLLQFGAETQKLALEIQKGDVRLQLGVGKVEMLYNNFENNMSVQGKAFDYVLQKVAATDKELALKLSNGLLKMESTLKDGKHALKESIYIKALNDKDSEHKAHNTYRDVKEEGDKIRNDGRNVLRDITQAEKDLKTRGEINSRENQIDAEKAQQIHELREKDIRIEKEQLRQVKQEIAHEREKYETAKRSKDSEARARILVSEYNMKRMKEREAFMLAKIRELQEANQMLTFGSDYDRRSYAFSNSPAEE